MTKRVRFTIDEIVGIPEIASMLGVEEATVHMWRRRARTAKRVVPFPEPARLISGRHPVWIWTEVREWAVATGRIQP